MPLYRIVLGHVFSWIGRGLGLIARHPWQAACLALLLIANGQCQGRKQAQAARDATRHALAAEQQGRAGDRTAYHAAQAQAAALAAAARAEAEARYQSIAERTDRNAQADLADARTLAADYARRMRAGPVAGRSCTALAAAPGEPAQGADRPGEAAVLPDAVMLSRADFDTMVENTVRLKAAHDWAAALDRIGS
ncbi:MAG: hypothetical protein KGL44_03740 [Sphingomonadales bacterium]|nr:hypothetical protein [Sphingomonadales bacterium]